MHGRRALNRAIAGQTLERDAFELVKGIRAAQKEARPREILEAAFEEFLEHGYAATRLDDIAARVGVTKGTIYVYFKNKEQLFETMVGELSQPSIDPERYQAALATQPALTVLEHYLTEVYRVSVLDRYSSAITRFLIAEQNTFHALGKRYKDAFVGPVLRTLALIIKSGCQNGEFRPEAAEIDQIFLLSPFIGYTFLETLAPESSPPPDRFFAMHMDMFRRQLVA